MKDFEEYFTFDSIVEQLAIQRSKLAFYIHKASFLERFTKKGGFNIEDPDKKADFDFLITVMPPRNKWSRPLHHELRSSFDSTVELNKRAIKNKIYEIHRRFKKGDLQFLDAPNWYQNLRKFIFEIKIEIFQSKQFEFENPVIFPSKKKPEDRSNIERRPLAKFSLRQRVILSLTNKYLTSIYDSEFLDCSFAFRSRNSKINAPTYHDAVSEIKEFRNRDKSIPLFIAECDIKKFFDCVDHKVFYKSYQALKNNLNSKGFTINAVSERILSAYLSCYCFNKNVYPLNDNTDYWINKKDYLPQGKFKWVEEYEGKYLEGLLEDERIGIPQGGALSGFIVNVLMHALDIELQASERYGSDFIYLRYCDDMIIIHKSQSACELLFKNYKENLIKINLIPHPSADLKKRYCKRFWDSEIKTREIYAWKNKSCGEVAFSPWISFVGYMINCEGHLKIRKKSIEKAVEKHSKEYKKALKRVNEIDVYTLAANQFSIKRSFESKLISMAVGKIDIAVYRDKEAKMCWGAGFKLLDNNKFSRAQLKKLDKVRKLALINFQNHIKNLTRNVKLEGTDDKKDINTDKTRYLYPFSHFSLLDRKK